MGLAEFVKLMSAISILAPGVAAAIKGIVDGAKGMSTEEFLSKADIIWDQIKADAQKELQPPTPPVQP